MTTKPKAEPILSADQKIDAMSVSEKKDAANPMIAVGVPMAMETLPAGHTYEDRVKAQAKSLGVVVPEGATLNYMLWLISMKASA